MNNLLLKYALSLLGFEQDAKGSEQYYYTKPPASSELYVWFDGMYNKFFMRDFRKGETMDTMLDVDSIEELQQFLTNLK